MAKILLLTARLVMLAPILCAGPAEALPIRAEELAVRHAGGINTLELIRDGTLAISEGPDAVNLWEVASGRLVKSWPAGAEGGPTLVDVSGRPGGGVTRVLAAGAGDPADGGRRRLDDAETGREIVLLESDEQVIATRLDTDGGRLATLRTGLDAGGNEISNTLRIWDVGAHAVVHTIELGTASGAADAKARLRIAASADGRWVAAARGDRVRVIAIASGEVRETTVETGGSDKPLQAVGFSADGDRLLLAAAEGPIQILATGDLSRLMAVKPAGAFTRFNVAEAVPSQVLRVGGRFETSYVDVASGKTLTHQRMGSAHPYRLDWVGRDLVLRASRSQSNPTVFGVYRHERGDFKLLFKRQRAGVSLGALRISPNGRCMILSDPAATSIAGATNGNVFATVAVKSPLDRAEFTPDGRMVLAADTDGQLYRFVPPKPCQGVAP